MAEELVGGIGHLSISRDTNSQAASENGDTASTSSWENVTPPQSSASSQKSSSAHTPPEDTNYFQQFLDFRHDPKATFLQNFNALATQQGWSKRERTRRLHGAIGEELDYLFGSDNRKLSDWQSLCRTVGIEGVPNSTKKCRNALGSRKVMVNLTNLIDHGRLGTELKKFRTFGEFRAYTFKHRYPKKLAKAGGIISVLLRHVL